MIIDKTYLSKNLKFNLLNIVAQNINCKKTFQMSTTIKINYTSLIFNFNNLMKINKNFKFILSSHQSTHYLLPYNTHIIQPLHIQ